MPDERQLAELEDAAVDLAREAGVMLRDRFGKPLEVEYKDKKKEMDPVTSADKDSQQLLVEGIGRRFPDHGILGEEDTGDEDTPAQDYLWVLDPLDGTTNYLNGLPLYAVSIGVLYKGTPVVAALFIPWPGNEGGAVLHARKGGGSKVDGVPLSLPPLEGPVPNRLSGLPGSFGGGFRFTKKMRHKIGELRVTGSIAYELAMVARGSIQYALFGGPRVWDVAAGVLIVSEAGGTVMKRPAKSKGWEALTFLGPSWENGSPGLKGFRSWAEPLIAGNSLIAPMVADNLHRRKPSIRGRVVRLARKLRSRKKPSSGHSG